MPIFNSWMLLVLMLGITGCTTAHTQTRLSNAAYVKRMAAASATAWPKLATIERLRKQTGFYAHAQILVYDGVNAWMVDANGYRPVSAGPVQALGLSSHYKTFEKLSWEGRPTVYMGLGQALPEQEAQRMLGNPAAVPELFALATHEAFHFFGQAQWQLNSGSRAVRYPAQPQPRQYRQHLISALHGALRGEADALGKARYWHDRWQLEFAQEAQEISYYDIVEGTAEYIEGLARILASGAADEPKTWAKTQLERFPSTAFLPLDGESYALGALAIYLLDRKDPDGWQAIIAGQTPAQRLLASVPAIVDVPDPALNQRIAGAVTEGNRNLESVIDPLITQLNHPGTRRLLVPMASIVGSIGMGGSYQVEQAPGEVFVEFMAQFSPSGGRITFEGAAVALTISQSCGEESGFVVVPIAAEEFPDGQVERLQLQKMGIEIDVPFPVKGTGSENVWCLRA
ncbi:hypothetical protein [Pseudomonas sp. 18175]|uniref:hypothetical protein n=1 Tax=Pseudomonas sp. 18175 TaxID=3390056 RepID=UPI003D1974DD